MRIRKTKQKERGVYKYISTVRAENGEYVEKTIILKPGEDGITELDIKRLHSLDDSEVYNNNKNLRPKRTKEEKEMMNRWKKAYIQKFIEEHGYEPNKEDVDYEMEQAFPKNYNVSIDNNDIDFDKSELGLHTAIHDDRDFEWSEKMLKIMEKMTTKQKEIINLMFIDELKQNEVAERLGISAAAVNTHFSKVKKIIRKYF